MKLFKLLGLATLLVGYVAVAPRPVMAQDSDADSIVVLAKHTEAKPNDPVQVKFEKFRVTKAKSNRSARSTPGACSMRNRSRQCPCHRR